MRKNRANWLSSMPQILIAKKSEEKKLNWYIIEKRA
jgi:hypothetical protein